MEVPSRCSGGRTAGQALFRVDTPGCPVFQPDLYLIMVCWVPRHIRGKIAAVQVLVAVFVVLFVLVAERQLSEGFYRTLVIGRSRGGPFSFASEVGWAWRSARSTR